MAQTFQGDATFKLHDKIVPYRFEVSATAENEVIVWIEDRVSKKQWQTDAMELKDFVTADSLIPKAKARDYAERFATCLNAKSDDTKFSRELSAIGAGGGRSLHLVLPLQWASMDLSVEYRIGLKEVPLEKVDILGARVRDIEERVNLTEKKELESLKREIQTLKAQNAVLSSCLNEISSQGPVCARLTSLNATERSHTVVWTADKGSTDTIVPLANGNIRLANAGVYEIHLTVFVNNSNMLSLMRGNESIVTWRVAYYNYSSTATLHHVMSIKGNAEIYLKPITFRLDAGLVMSIVKL